jgi:hypothetical protein
MKTALDIISEACRTMGLSAPTSFADISGKQTQRMLGSLNRTAEDLTLSHNWLTQTRLKTFTLDPNSSLYDPLYEGYDLDLLTDRSFERFSSSFLWDMTNKVRVDGITVDKFLESAATASLPDTLVYMRMGKFLKFYPKDIEGRDIQFYYQTKNIAYTESLPTNKEFDTFSDDIQIPYHNPKLLLRGILLNYARNEGIENNDQFKEDYEKFLKKSIGEEAPAATIKFMSNYGEAYLGRFPFIGG